MLKALSLIVVLVAVAFVLIEPDPKLKLMSLGFQGTLAVFTQLEPETHPSGTSREYRGLEKLFRTMKLSNDPTFTEDNPHLFEKVTENMDGFPAMVPARSDIKKTSVYIKNGEVEIHSYWGEHQSSRDDRVFLYFHGGGMFSGKASQELGCSDEIAFRAGAKVLSVDYRLLDKHTAKEAVSDMITAYKWLLTEKKYKPDQVVIWGCSGGGMASLLTGLQIVASGLPNPRRIVIGSPGFGLEILYPGVIENPLKYRELPTMQAEILHDIDSMLDVGHITDKMVKVWIQNKDYLLPLYNNATGIAKTFIWAGGEECLASSDELGANYFIKQGADVTFEKSPHMGHCFGVFHNTPEGNAYINKLLKFAWD